jgi:hypothetical protein
LAVLGGFRHVDGPYSLPLAGGRLRLAFVGPPQCLAASADCGDRSRLDTVFIEHGAGIDTDVTRERVERFAPHVVVAFRPEALSPGAFGDLRAPVIGFVAHPPEQAAGAVDPANVDRLVAADPSHLADARVARLAWRSLPAPVADRLYQPVAPIRSIPRLLFVGRSSAHRERWLLDIKHRFDCLHIAHDLEIDELSTVLRRRQITVYLRGAGDAFDPGVLAHFAAGHLVIADSLSPCHGLETGLDYVEVAYPEELTHAASVARAFPNAFHRIRYRGRQKVERHRASRVWPALVRELFRDLAARGTHRTTAVAG